MADGNTADDGATLGVALALWQGLRADLPMADTKTDAIAMQFNLFTACLEAARGQAPDLSKIR